MGSYVNTFITPLVPTCRGVAPSQAYCVPVPLSFTPTQTEQIISLESIKRLAPFDLQAIFVDQSANNSPLTILIPITGQVIVAMGNTQGYYAVMSPSQALNAELQLYCSCTPNVPSVAPLLILSNVPEDSYVWGATI